MQARYTASATATGDGRDGHVRSSDGVLDLDLAVPAEMGGAGGPRTNPEQLFAAGYAGCFHNALRRVGRRANVPLTDSAVTVDVGIGPHASGDGFGLTVLIEAEIPGADEATAKDLLEQAHRLCPYSRATRGDVEVTITLA